MSDWIAMMFLDWYVETGPLNSWLSAIKKTLLIAISTPVFIEVSSKSARKAAGIRIDRSSLT